MPFVGHHLIGPPRAGPIVSIWHGDLFRLSHVQFATEEAGWSEGEDFFYMYEEASSHPKKPKTNLRRLAKGEKITVSEWVRKKPSLPKGRRLPVCLKRNGELRCLATFLVPAKLRGETRTFSVTPILNGSDSAIKVVKQEEELPDRHNRFFSIKFAFKEMLPDVVGRHSLKLQWRIDGHRFRVFNGSKWKVSETVETEHVLYTAYGPPLEPDHAKSGATVSPDKGTLTGTQKRFDVLTRAFGSSRRRAATDESSKIELCWDIHKAINDDNPPYFHGGNDQRLTTEAFPTWVDKPESTWPKDKIFSVEDQWLMWVKTGTKSKKGKKKPRHWNDASCIGHAQLQKTMLASIGMKGQLTWVFPHTTQLPFGGSDPKGEHSPGDRLTFSDRDLYALETDSTPNAKRQWWDFEASVPDAHGTMRTKKFNTYVALMHGNAKGWEHFEGCLLSYGDRFLTGGFPTWRNPKSVRKNMGFSSAKELLSWWTSMSEAGGKRFLCWIGYDSDTKFTYFFDAYGSIHTDPAKIRKGNLQLEWDP